MDIHMTFKHMDATPALKQHVEEKTEKLKKFINGKDQVHADWTFYLEKEQQVADLRVKGSYVDCFAQAKTANLYQSIDEVTHKVEKQLRKHKEITKDHLHR